MTMPRVIRLGAAAINAPIKNTSARFQLFLNFQPSESTKMGSSVKANPIAKPNMLPATMLPSITLLTR